MIRIGIKESFSNRFSQSNQVSVSHRCSRFGRYYTTQTEENKTIKSYPNIFTQKGEGVLLHLPKLGGSAAEKRLEFVRLYLQSNHLIGNRSLPLKDLTIAANEKGFKTSGGKETKPYFLKKTLLRFETKGQFEFFKDDNGELHTNLTEEGKRVALDRAELLNAVDPDIPDGRAKDILNIFKEKGWLDQEINVKILIKECAGFLYEISQYHIKEILRREHHLFILDTKLNSISLSTVGKNMVNELKEGVESIKPSKIKTTNNKQ